MRAPRMKAALRLRFFFDVDIDDVHVDLVADFIIFYRLFKGHVTVFAQIRFIDQTFDAFRCFDENAEFRDRRDFAFERGTGLNFVVTQLFQIKFAFSNTH